MNNKIKKYCEHCKFYSVLGCQSTLICTDGNRFLVSSTQKVKRGKWIWVKNYRDCEGDIYSQYKCSCCDFGVGGVYSIKDLTHFCPNCGADMRGDTNE